MDPEKQNNRSDKVVVKTNTRTVFGGVSRLFYINFKLFNSICDKYTKSNVIKQIVRESLDNVLIQGGNSNLMISDTVMNNSSIKHFDELMSSVNAAIKNKSIQEVSNQVSTLNDLVFPDEYLKAMKTPYPFMEVIKDLSDEEEQSYLEGIVKVIRSCKFVDINAHCHYSATDGEKYFSERLGVLSVVTRSLSVGNKESREVMECCLGTLVDKGGLDVNQIMLGGASKATNARTLFDVFPEIASQYRGKSGLQVVKGINDDISKLCDIVASNDIGATGDFAGIVLSLVGKIGRYDEGDFTYAKDVRIQDLSNVVRSVVKTDKFWSAPFVKSVEQLITCPVIINNSRLSVVQCPDPDDVIKPIRHNLLLDVIESDWFDKLYFEGGASKVILKERVELLRKAGVSISDMVRESAEGQYLNIADVLYTKYNEPQKYNAICNIINEVYAPDSLHRSATVSRGNVSGSLQQSDSGSHCNALVKTIAVSVIFSAIAVMLSGAAVISQDTSLVQSTLGGSVTGVVGVVCITAIILACCTLLSHEKVKVDSKMGGGVSCVEGVVESSMQSNQQR